MSYSFIAISVVLLICVSVVCDFDENTPEFVERRKRMLELLAQDECGKMPPWKKDRPDDYKYSYIWGPREDKTKGDENCEEAAHLLVRLPGPEPAECVGVVLPRCRRVQFHSTGPRHQQHQWMCTVIYHDEDKPKPPEIFPLRMCVEKSLEVYAKYMQSVEAEISVDETETSSPSPESPKGAEKPRSRIGSFKIHPKIGKMLEILQAEISAIARKLPKIDENSRTGKILGKMGAEVGSIRRRFPKIEDITGGKMYEKLRSQISFVREKLPKVDGTYKGKHLLNVIGQKIAGIKRDLELWSIKMFVKRIFR